MILLRTVDRLDTSPFLSYYTPGRLGIWILGVDVTSLQPRPLGTALPPPIDASHCVLQPAVGPSVHMYLYSLCWPERAAPTARYQATARRHNRYSILAQPIPWAPASTRDSIPMDPIDLMDAVRWKCKGKSGTNGPRGISHLEQSSWGKRLRTAHDGMSRADHEPFISIADHPPFWEMNQ